MDPTGGRKIIAASRIGAEHLRVARNNQDAFAVTEAGGRLVAVVADGCSEGASSEVGAVLGARWIAGRLARAGGVLSERGAVESAAEALALDLDRALALWSEGDPALVAGCFLFTFLAAVVEAGTLSVIGVGDGVLVTPEGARAIDPGPDNAPAYAAYRILSDDAFEGAAPPRPVPVVHHVGPFGPSDRALVATDGARPVLGELEGWLADPALWSNARALERRLNVRARDLLDDTTLVGVRSCA